MILIRWILVTGSLFSLSGIRAEAQWTSYLNSHTVNEIADQDSFIWCGTTGAVARFHKRDTTFAKFTNADGLADNIVNALAIDGSGNLWFVHEDSSVTVTNGVDQWKRFFSSNGILGDGLSIAIQGDTLWVGTNHGIWRLDPIGNPFDETFSYELFQNDYDILSIAIKDSFLFFGRDDGFCESSKGNPSLCQNFYTTMDSLPSNFIQEILLVGDTLWVGTPNGVAWKTIIDTLWNPITTTGMPSPNVRTLACKNDTLWAGTDNGVGKWTGSSWNIVNDGLQNYDIRSILVDKMDTVWVGTGGKGIAKLEGSIWRHYLSNDIVHNWVTDVAVDLDGSVWCAHYPRNNFQISHLRLDGKWEIFNENKEWNLQGDGGPRYIGVDPFGNKWIGSWGGWSGGINIIQLTESSFDTFRLPYANYAVSSMAIDPLYNKWFFALKPLFGEGYLCRLKSDNSWGFPGKFIVNIILAIAIDSTGVKWLGGNGVHRLDDGGTPEDETDDLWEEYYESDGLPSNSVLGIEVDRWNRVWVATRGGAAVIERGVVTPFSEDDQGKFLGTVTDIAFDIDGGVWFQTENIGLARRGPDGRWDSYGESDGLVSEEITSGWITALDSNIKTGEIWIGTAYGLSRFESPFKAKYAIDSLEVFPNPFIPSRGHPFITFKNLPPDATLYIFTLSGERIKKIDGNDSSLVIWNGLNDSGEETASGLYLFTVTDPRGGKKVGKFVIVR